MTSTMDRWTILREVSLSFMKNSSVRYVENVIFVIWLKVKTGGHETRWSQIYHCLYCYFTGHFSIILNGFSFNHLLLFLLLTDVNEGDFAKPG